MEKNLCVSRPFTSAKYDFIVDNGMSLSRVQVKSCHRWKSGKEKDVWSANVYTLQNRKRRPYRKDEIEFVVCYLHEVEVSYIIPISEVGERMSLNFYPMSGKGKWESYRERWGLLTTYGP